MKKHLFLLFLFVHVLSYGQSLSNYKYLVMSKRYAFQEATNEYRLNSNTRSILAGLGFEVLFDDEVLPEELAKDRCKAMYLDINKPDSFMAVKLQIVFKDCQNKVLFTSEGASKEKQRSVAFNESLNIALNSVKTYKYESGITAKPETVSSNENVLSAKAISNGFQLVDNQNNTVMTILKTSNKDCFLATKNNIQGVLISKDYQWFFEYYEGSQFFSEKVRVSF